MCSVKTVRLLGFKCLCYEERERKLILVWCRNISFESRNNMGFVKSFCERYIQLSQEQLSKFIKVKVQTKPQFREAEFAKNI